MKIAAIILMLLFVFFLGYFLTGRVDRFIQKNCSPLPDDLDLDLKKMGLGLPGTEQFFPEPPAPKPADETSTENIDADNIDTTDRNAATITDATDINTAGMDAATITDATDINTAGTDTAHIDKANVNTADADVTGVKQIRVSPVVFKQANQKQTAISAAKHSHWHSHA